MTGRRSLLRLGISGAASAALAISGLLAPASLAQAAGAASAATAREGWTRLVWSRFVDTDGSAARIVIRDQAGGAVRELTHSTAGVVDIDPRISPDGRQVVLERDLPDGSTQIVLVGTNGRGEHVLGLGCTDPCAVDVDPTWTPDGRHILFTRVVGPFDQVNGSARSAVLWRADLTGGRVERVSPPGYDGAFEDSHATFAPAGYLVFVKVRNADITSAVFRMNPDGTHARQLTPWAIDADLPAVSPARSGPTKDLVVFETFGHGAPADTSASVATVPATCASESACTAQVKYLTPQHVQPQQNFNPNWSPDGRQIAFVRFTSSPTGPSGDIWSMRWDGTRQRPVSQSPLFEFRPDWGPAPEPETRNP